MVAEAAVVGSGTDLGHRAVGVVDVQCGRVGRDAVAVRMEQAPDRVDHDLPARQRVARGVRRGVL